MIGIVLGNRYELVEEIGKGGMANVYKAHCKLLNRMVAVKILKKDLETDEEFLKRFNAEAQSAASLVHPNIVSIFDFGYDQGYHYIVMELIEGITLKEYINENAPLDTKDALSIAYQICDALSAAHSNNIVHRDIKPHNIMITSDRRIKVTDFGIARASDGSTMTADHNILGSVHYISPEQAKGSVVDCKTDLYSMGVVMYEMLTGHVPFQGETPVAVAMMHINDTPVNPSEYNPGLSDSAEAMVLKSIEKNPNVRYQSAKDMMLDIMKLLENPDAVLFDTEDAEDDFDSTRKISPVHKDILTGRGDIKNKEANDEDDIREELENRRKQRQKDKISKREGRKIVAGAIITAILVVGGVSLWITNLLFPGIFPTIEKQEELVAPDFMNMSIDDARKIAKSKGLLIEIEDEVEDDSEDEGTIIDQSPEEGTEVKEGDVINVTITVGSKKVSVPNVVYDKVEVARAALEKKGFNVSVIEEYDDEIPENCVISQSPKAGDEARKGSTIKIVVSKGEEEKSVTVPYVVGKTLTQAKKALENENLELGDITYQESSTVDKDIVISQSVSSGSIVSEYTSVDVVVSSGKKENKTDKKEEKNPSDEKNNSQNGNSQSSNSQTSNTGGNKGDNSTSTSNSGSESSVSGGTSSDENKSESEKTDTENTEVQKSDESTDEGSSEESSQE